MILSNKLNITNQVELARAEERVSKQKAKQLFDSLMLRKAITYDVYSNCHLAINQPLFFNFLKFQETCLIGSD